MNDILNAYKAGSEIGQGFHRVGEAMHEQAVRGKMDEILRATAERGGDITMVDPNMYLDRVGLEAMGRVASDLANTEAYRTKIMQNNALHAKHRFGMFQQYMADIDDAIKQGDQGRTIGLMSNMAAQSGTPYRFSPTEDGQIRVTFVTPEGEVDKGSMGMLEAYNLLKPYATNQDRFIRDSVMYGMATQEENMAYMMNPSKWRTVKDARGGQYTLIPQRIQRNGQTVPGFLVSGPGGQRNMTADEVTRAGFVAEGGGLTGGAGGVATAGLSKDTIKRLDDYSETVDPTTGQKGRDPHMFEALSMLTMAAGGNADRAVIALRDNVLPSVMSQLFDENGEPRPEAADVAEQWMSMTDGQKALYAVTWMMQQQAQASGNAPKAEQKAVEPASAPAQGNPVSNERWDRALKGKGQYKANWVPEERAREMMDE